MKINNILIGVFSLITFTAFAQHEKSDHMELATAVTELKLKTENFDELKNFDWNMVKEIFQENNTDQEITLAIAYVNTSEVDKSKVRIDNFEMEFTGKLADLDNLTARLKKSIDRLDEFNDQNTKN
ncbi:hypothetical protein SAMN04488009_2303 [Maribacter sedimenticola]|uniref:Uncharacterized protein n=1 Tax=Maribacter sedimenticola TaxID=228956 RepID=A0ABY1SHY7_9FLAO|nr:hypothetical protein [Maribacter sedimenticola]SNR54654.1 hypothetical protein SAMN04488009_2303 [Maribacter sedimenticola]